MPRPLTLSLRMLRTHRACDACVGEALLLHGDLQPLGVRTTQAWSIHVMNAAGYLAGFLLAIKLAIRVLTGYRNRVGRARHRK